MYQGAIERGRSSHASEIHGERHRTIRSAWRVERGWEISAEIDRWTEETWNIIKTEKRKGTNE